ncbi:MAG TPA: hypothetical protein VMG38_20615 [Trebonia sp.]|nr:hypothetical protein [Trebonia sp.]
MPGSTAPPAAPSAIGRAVLLMCAGAAVTVVQGVVSGLTTNNVASYAYSSTSHHSATVHDSRSLSAGIIGGLAFAGFWLWMAWKNGSGRNWARVLSSVFFGLLCLQFAGGAVTLARSALPVLDFLILALVWAVGLAATIHLWRRESSEFFASARQVRQLGQPGPRMQATPTAGHAGATGHGGAHSSRYQPPESGATYPGYEPPGSGRPPQYGHPPQYGLPPQYGSGQPQYGEPHFEELSPHDDGF